MKMISTRARFDGIESIYVLSQFCNAEALVPVKIFEKPAVFLRCPLQNLIIKRFLYPF